MKIFLIISLLLSSLAFGQEIQNSRFCRNATNTIIYIERESTSVLTVTRMENGVEVPVILDLSNHDIELFDQIVLGVEATETFIRTTSTLKILITAKDRSVFPENFLDRNSDGSALFTNYICIATKVR